MFRLTFRCGEKTSLITSGGVCVTMLGISQKDYSHHYRCYVCVVQAQRSDIPVDCDKMWLCQTIFARLFFSCLSKSVNVSWILATGDGRVVKIFVMVSCFSK